MSSQLCCAQIQWPTSRGASYNAGFCAITDRRQTQLARKSISETNQTITSLVSPQNCHTLYPWQIWSSRRLTTSLSWGYQLANQTLQTWASTTICAGPFLFRKLYFLSVACPSSTSITSTPKSSFYRGLESSHNPNIQQLCPFPQYSSTLPRKADYQPGG